MKRPEDVRAWLRRRYENQHRDWLSCPQRSRWPLEVALGTPTEEAARRHRAAVTDWHAAWQSWEGPGTLCWCERRWPTLGTQRLPERLLLADPREVAQWIGESERWSRACARHATLAAQWPALTASLGRHFAMLADYGDDDFQRLLAILSWVIAHPGSQLYPRQIPVAGLDSKWLDGRRGLMADLVAKIRGEDADGGDFFSRCGLRAPPELIRIRILDPSLRLTFGGLGDITAPWEEVAALPLAPYTVFIVENLQTGLAFGDVPGAVVIMGLGYGVDVLGRLPWLADAHCLYWGDIDTHGFAILNRARHYRPDLSSLLMDAETLTRHKSLWGTEKTPHTADHLPLLSAAEQDVYQALKGNRWGHNIRLEQERIAWPMAWGVIVSAAARRPCPDKGTSAMTGRIRPG